MVLWVERVWLCLIEFQSDSTTRKEKIWIHVFALFPSTRWNTLSSVEVPSSNRKTTITHNNFRYCRISFSSFVRQPYSKQLYIKSEAYHLELGDKLLIKSKTERNMSSPNVPVKSKLKHPPGLPPRHLNFWKIFVQIPPSRGRKAVQMPHYRSIPGDQMPPPSGNMSVASIMLRKLCM